MMNDLRHAIRALLKRPAFTATAVIVLAVGTGANAAIFSVIEAVFLQPLPYPNSHRLVTVFDSNSAFRQAGITASDFLYWRSRQCTFEGMFAYRTSIQNLSGEGTPRRVSGIAATAAIFDVLKIKPALGSAFSEGSERKGAEFSVFISFALWQEQFGGDPLIVGKVLRLDGDAYSIAGVLPEGFTFTQPVDIITRLDLARVTQTVPNLRMIARLGNDTTHAQAAEESRVIAQELRTLNTSSDDRKLPAIDIVPLQDLLHEHSQRGLLLLFAATGLVLLMACANLANLQLARAAQKRRECGIRKALGATRWRLIRQLLTESIVVSIVGGLVGTVLALWGLEALLALAPPTLPRVNRISIDGQVLGFTLVTAVMAGILFGLAPALQSAQTDITSALKDGKDARTGLHWFGLRKLLIISEVSLALVLLTGAGLLLNSLARLWNVDPGFNPKNLLTINLRLAGGEQYRSLKNVASFYHESISRLRMLPGVTAVGTVNKLPLGDRQLRGRLMAEGRQDADKIVVDTPTIGGDYFEAMGISLLAGRTFTEEDTVESPQVVVISESLARECFADQTAIGARISFENDSNNNPIWIEIVGIVGDVRQEALAARMQPTAYIPYTQTGVGLRDPYFLLRTSINPAIIADAARKELQTVDPGMPIVSARTMNQVIAVSLSEQRFTTLLLGLFSSIAMALAIVGLYGVASNYVSARIQEIGIRVAIGARPMDISRMVIRQVLLLVFIGVTIGLGASVVLTRLMGSLLFGVGPSDPTTFGGAAVLLTFVSMLTCYPVANRAAKIDPMIALKYE